MYFDRGIDNYGAWLTVLKEHKLVKVGGAWYTLTDEQGKEHKFQSKDWEDLITNNDELREYIYKIICFICFTYFYKFFCFFWIFIWV